MRHRGPHRLMKRWSRQRVCLIPGASVEVFSPSHWRIGRWLFWTVLLGVVIALRYVIFPFVTHGQTKNKAAQQGSGPRPTPVVAVAAEQGDMPVYLTGLGTVTALQTVTVKSRVDGQLVRATFREG